MVKLVAKICAFFLIFALIIGSLDKCTGSSADKFFDDILNLSRNDKEDIDTDDIKNANPDQLNIYVNVYLSKIEQKYISCNTTNVTIIQEYENINLQINNCNQSISNQTAYINRSNINQNTLINWASDNRANISQLESMLSMVEKRIIELESEISSLNPELIELRSAVEQNSDHFDKYIDKYNRDVKNVEEQKYNALIEGLNERIEELSSKISVLSREAEKLKTEHETLGRKVNGCIKELKKLNEKLDQLIAKVDGMQQQEQKEINYYFIIDTVDVLKKKGIVMSSGIFNSLTVNPNPNKDYFGILTDKNKTISLGDEDEDFEVISDMPSDSYQFRVINGIKVLIIKDIKDFWSNSEYLVIEKK